MGWLLFFFFLCACPLNLTPVCFGHTGGGGKKKKNKRRGSKALKLEQTPCGCLSGSTVLNSQPHLNFMCLATLAFGLPFASLADNERRPSWLQFLAHARE